jgi:hypothetical protein
VASLAGSTRTRRSIIDETEGPWVDRVLAPGRRRHPRGRLVLRGAGIGGSWFVYGGDRQWAFQRDWFDYGNAASLFLEMMGDGTLSDGMQARMDRSLKPGQLPGHYPIRDVPVGLWDRPS